VLADAAQVDLQRLSLGPSNYIGIETGFNSTFNRTINDIPNYGANGLAGIMALGGLTHVHNVDGCCSLAQVILAGDMSGKNFILTNGNNECGVLESAKAVCRGCALILKTGANSGASVLRPVPATSTFAAVRSIHQATLLRSRHLVMRAHFGTGSRSRTQTSGADRQSWI
jgi:hypothetical protein